MKRCCEVTLGLRLSVSALRLLLLPILLLTMMGAAPAQDIVQDTVAANDGATWFVDQPDDGRADNDQADDVQADDDDLDQDDQDQFDQRDGDGERRHSYRRFWPRWRPTDEHERNHRAVREAFRDVVKEASDSTVQIYSNDRRVALGTIIDQDGLVLTKASEIRDQVEVRLNDDRRFAAELVNVNDELDVAVLRIDATGLKPIHWRENEPPAAGSWLATVGTGELPTAVGVVSAAPRAIPMPQPVLGVMLEDSQAGVRIGSVMPESPAEEAGLEQNDVVLELNGKAIEKREQLVKLIRGLRPGDTVDLLIRRDDEKLTIQATLTEINSLAQGRRVDFQNTLGGPLSSRRWGFPSVLQHDTVLRPRDCGGPIVDLYGNAVGVNIARAGRVASYALPVSALAPVLDEVRAGVYVRKDTNSGNEEPGVVAAEDSLSQVENVAPDATLTSQK